MEAAVRAILSFSHPSFPLTFTQMRLFSGCLENLFSFVKYEQTPQ